LAPINSEKHITNQSLATVLSGTLTTKDIAIAVAVASKDASNEVEEGAVIKAIWPEIWLSTGLASGFGTATVTIEKLPSGLTPMTFTQSNNLGAYPNKKNILFTFQGLIPNYDSNPIAPGRGWLKIPKGKQRMGLGDKLVANYSAITNDLNTCGVYLYKEYK